MSKEHTRIFSGTLYNYLTSLLVFALTAVNTIIIANAVGSRLYGNYAAGSILLDLLSGISAVGMGASLIRFIPDFLIRRKFRSVNTVISTASIVVISVTLTLTVVSFLASPFIAIKVFGNYWLTPFLQYMSLIFPLLSITILLQWILNGFQRFDLAMSMRVLFISFYFLFAVIFLELGFSIEGVIYAFALGYAFSGLFGFFFYLREKRKMVKSNKKFKNKIFDFGLFKEMVSFGKWDYGTSFVNLGFMRTNEILIGVFLTTTILGIYGIAQSVASIFNFIGGALATTLNPYLSELTAINMRKKVVDLIKRSTRYSLILSLLFSAPIIVFAYQILESVFTQSYLSAAEPLKILTIAFVVSNISGPIGSYFFARKKLWVNFSIISISSLIGIVLTFIFIPVFGMNGLNQTWGMIGAAIAYVSGCVVSTVLFAFFARRSFKINILEKKSAILAVIFLVGISVLAFLTMISFVLSVLGLVVFEVALGVKYKRELLNFAKTAEAYLLPSQKKVVTNK